MDEPQCLNDYRHGPAVGDHTIDVRDDVDGDPDDYTPVVELLCAYCLSKARTA